MAQATKEEVPWLLPAQKRYILYNGQLIDPREGKLHPNVTVTIAAGRIESVQKHDSEESRGSTPVMVDVPDNTVEIDLEGKYICPGLIDCHVHMNAVAGEKGLYAMKMLDKNVAALRSTQMAKQMIMRGFTTARDCGGTTVAMKEAIADGVVNGPRLFVALNQLTQTGGHGDMRGRLDTTYCCGGHDFGSGRLCDGVDECLKVTRDQIRRGADFIKIMGGGGVSSPTDAIDSVQFTPEEVKTIAGVAKINKTYVSCHAYTPDSIRNAIDNGVRAIEHGNLLDDETAALMAEKGCILTPTLVTYKAMASERFTSYLPPEGVAKNAEVLEAGRRSLEIAEKAGVTMCYGTDLLGPMAHLQTNEFAIRAEVLSAEKILKMATTNAAELLMREGQLGEVKTGYLADLLVLSRNPLEDIRVLDDAPRNVLVVMKDGRVHCSRWRKMPAEVDMPLEVIE